MSLFVRYSCFWVSFVYIVTSVLAYHFNVDNIILYEGLQSAGSRGSYFGYTVALWNPGNRNLSESWIFIGAPRANSSAYPGVHEPGTVFKCNIGKECKEWVMSNDISERHTKGSWLGGAMNIENKTDPEILVCAPRWTERMNRRMRGSCYMAKAKEISNSTKSVETYLHPLKNADLTKSQYYFYALGQSGFSIHVIPDTDTFDFVLGCPGVLLWHGTQIRFKARKKDFITPKSLHNLVGFFEYSGYAVTSGDYFGNGKRIYATGVPRGRSLKGSIFLLYDFSKEIGARDIDFTKLHGEGIGEYFGAALASCDINGDGKDDLLVGAPQWTRTLDEGRVYSFRGTKGRFEPLVHVDGYKLRGRFGSAITCLGDIDYDGYADVAIGAPYDGNGAVYIFHGSENGLTSNPQKIAGPKATRGFGISISEPRDVDNNGYADIAVGAYLSGHVTLIRSKRVVTMAVKVKPNFIGEQLDLKAESFSVNVCSTYGGPHAPQELNVIKELKIDQMYGRARVEIDGNKLTTYKFSDTLKSNATQPCRNFTIMITKTANFEYFNPLQLLVSQRLNITEKNSEWVVGPNNISGSDNFDTSDVVTRRGDSARVEYALDIPFKIDCNNNTCRSNLSIEMTTDLEDGAGYVIGTIPSHLRLNIRVDNSGDNAYSAKAYINIPSFIKILKQPSTCEKNRKNTTNIEIMCEIGNPLTKMQMANFSIDLDMFEVPIETTAIKFETVTETSSENIGDNEADLSIDSVIQADIGLTGTTNKDWYSFIQRQEEEQISNIMFQHTYEIRNHEITPLCGAMLSVSIPTHWILDDNEIEIVKLNETVGELDGNQFHCSSADEDSDTRLLSYDATTVTEWLIGENSSGLITQWEKKFTNIGGKIYSASPENRTLYINTTNPAIKWKTINCTIGPFKNAQSAAKVVLIFDLLLHNLTPKIMNEKDIIFFASNGSTKITGSPRFIQTVNNKSDVIMIGTMFIGSSPARQIATWFIALSVLIGLLILALFVFGLYKFGFFKRSEKLKLEALIKENEDVGPKVVLETTSSTEDFPIA